MSDIGDTYKRLKKQRQHDAGKRRELAESTWRDAARIASTHKLLLVRKTESHFQLINGTGWLINLYPGNQRIFADRNRGPAPFIDVPRPWTLMDVVKAAIYEHNDESTEVRP